MWFILPYLISFMLALVFFQLFFRESKRKKLRAQIIGGGRVSEAQSRELYDLFQQFFVDEFNTLEAFAAELRKGFDLLLFYDQLDKLAGFIIVHAESYTVNQRTVRVIEGEFFGLKKEFRRDPLPLFTLAKYCMLHKLRFPFTPMFYFFITYSYRSYLSFGRTIGNYWPRHTHDTPPFEQSILDFLGKKAAKDWGEYRPKTCVIVDKTHGQRGRLAMTLSEPRMFTKTIDFFFNVDPGFRQGDCLCVLAEISWLNVLRGVWKIVGRFKGASKEDQIKQRLRAAEAQTDQDVAFGRSIRKTDQKETELEFEQFVIDVGPVAVDDLSRKLKDTRPLPNSVNLWKEIGFDPKYLEELSIYWQKEFDWEQAQQELNRYPMYRTVINDTSLLFLHVSSTRHDAMPIVLLHSFPSSPYEFYNLIPMLTEPEDRSQPAFHVVCPFLPGCGWSEPLKNLTGPEDIAALIGKLMVDIDYRVFVAHGTGWGALIASQLAVLNPLSCLAVHLGSPFPNHKPKKILTRIDHFFRWQLRWFLFSEQDAKLMDKFDAGAYHELISAERETAIGVHDSPYALLAFFVKRYLKSTDCRGNIENTFTKDELLTHISIHWFAQSMSTSLWMCSSTMAALKDWPPHPPIRVPVVVVEYPMQFTLPHYFSRDIYPKLLRREKGRKGGYLPAWENPTELVESLQNFLSDAVPVTKRVQSFGPMDES